jgi:hypothetical protein
MLAPGPNDVVVFYYDGHGFRLDTDTDPYPRMDIRLNNFNDPVPSSLKLSWVSNTIKAKKARLSLVVGDCCNSVLGSPRLYSYGSGLTDRSLNTLSSVNCSQLFLRARAHIIATSASAGQSALGGDNGGIFTRAFISAIDFELSTFTGNPSWTSLMSSTREQTIDFSRVANCNTPPCRHDPIYLIDGLETTSTTTTVSNNNTATGNQFTTSNKKPQARIKSVWEEFNVVENGVKGMRIHIKFIIYNSQDQAATCNVYFYTAEGKALKDYNKNYYSSTGDVACGKTFIPGYENTLYENFTLFIPYAELHLGKGRSELKYDVELHSAGEGLATSKWYYFHVDK